MEVNKMLQQATIPKTPEEVAGCLSQLTEMEQCVVKGVIIGLKEARRNHHPPRETEAQQDSA